MICEVLTGDSLQVLKSLEDNSIDSIVTDPPYELGFMGRAWDSSGIAFNVDLWRECLRVLKPGGHLLAFSGTRTYHRMAVAIEDAGFEIRDCIQWIYGTGFPKSHNISKAIDKAAGAERKVVGTKKKLDSFGVANDVYGGGPDHCGVMTITEPATEDAAKWDGWGTALKPANEPICVARKPLEGTVADNVLRHGTGGLNINACRIGDEVTGWGGHGSGGYCGGLDSEEPGGRPVVGRWPANVILDDITDKVVDQKAGKGTSRFFYVVKPDGKERDCGALADEGTERANTHTTVKPIKLMEYLCKLITPDGGTVLDPFCGSGTTGIAAQNCGFGFVGIDLLPEHAEIARKRMSFGGLFG